MRRLLLISLATIPLTGCQFFNRDTTVVDVIESVESGEALEAIPNSIPTLGGDDAEADAEAFEDPTIEGSEPVGTVKADLIPSTSAEARRKAIARSRVDPFAVLPIPPTPDPVVLSPDAVAVARNGGGQNTGRGGSAARNAANTGSGSNAANARPVAARPEPTPPPVRVQPPNEPLVLPSPIAALPSIPQPVIAPTISVSGVIQLGNEPYAIVRSGSEPERYVRVGDRLGGGSVRVKRIETLAFEPRVILEENGIEVSRPITTGDDNSEVAEETPVAANVSTPVAPIPQAQPAVSVLPNIPLSAPLALPTPTSSLQPTPGSVPSSLLLQPAETNTQAVIPGFQIAVPAV